MNERNYPGDFLAWEVERNYTRETRTIKQNAIATAGLPAGQVLQDDGGKHVVCTTGASANGILVDAVSLDDLKAGDVKAAVLMRGPALVKSAGLTISAAQLAAALAALAALGIRTSATPTYTTQTT